MREIAFAPASKKSCHLRAAMFGPSGAGKTYSALRIATGLAEGSRFAVIDTEHRSASKYADRFRFDVCELTSHSVDDYVAALDAAAAAGYRVVVIDSLTHGWQDLLAEVDRLANSKHKGNTWGAWREGTPKQRKLVQAILGFPGHLIATMRAKTEWGTERADNGKVKPVRNGLGPEQGKGIEYEFDMLFELDTDHNARIIKDRSGKYQDQFVAMPDEEFGRSLGAWLSDGDEPPPVPQGLPEPDAASAPRSATLTDSLLLRAGEGGGAEGPSGLTPDQATALAGIRQILADAGIETTVETIGRRVSERAERDGIGLDEAIGLSMEDASKAAKGRGKAKR